jgi:hypothetical protein
MLEREPAARLSLDELAFSEGIERRPLEACVAEALEFIASNDSWIVEGCYGDIVAPLLPHADTLIFLNPGVETCVAHCQARPWEPEKFESHAAQEANLQNLIDWVRAYESRDDEYGLKRHRALFDAFKGRKVEYNQPSEYRPV